MIVIHSSISMAGTVEWSIFDPVDLKDEEGVMVTFTLYEKVDKRHRISKFREKVESTNITWISFEKINCTLDLDDLRKQFKDLEQFDWLKGRISVDPDFENIKEDDSHERTLVRLILTKEEVILRSPPKIFLSHKGIDKPLIREFKWTLEIIGFEAWFDEDSMVAGDELERTLIKGFEESCAAVFFITQAFKDEDFLATEINYAIAEKRKKRERFAIITLLLPDEGGTIGEVPTLLRQYVWKNPKTNLNALRNILKALPIEVGEVRWKEHLKNN